VRSAPLPWRIDPILGGIVGADGSPLRGAADLERIVECVNGQAALLEKIAALEAAAKNTPSPASVPQDKYQRAEFESLICMMAPGWIHRDTNGEYTTAWVRENWHAWCHTADVLGPLPVPAAQN
jgi:hypothetical protein